MGLNVLKRRMVYPRFRCWQTAQKMSLILLDWNMPRMNGAETLERLQQLALDIPVLILSGDEGNHVDVGHRLVQGTLKKPFPAQGLARHLRGVLP